MKRYCIGVLAFVLLGAPLLSAGDSYADAWTKGLSYLKSAQNDDGSWGKAGQGNVGITAVALESLTLTPEGARSFEGLAIMQAKAAQYLAGCQVNEKGRFDGAICDLTKYANYCTSLAVMALCKYDREKFAPVIAKAVAWVKRQQANRATGYDPKKHTTFGGFGYGSSTRPDLSNTWIALEALKAAGVPKDDPVWKDVQVFVKRCQNSTEVNDMDPKFVGDDGGAHYLPAAHDDASPAGKEVLPSGKTIFKSYGSMSYAMLLSYLWSDMKKEENAVRHVVKWLEKNYTVAANTNTQKEGQQGLFYYYRVMAKSLSAYGEPNIAGHVWAKDLADAVVQRQGKDGSWSNPQDRWGEGTPELVTGYSLTTLALCQKFMK